MDCIAGFLRLIAYFTMVVIIDSTTPFIADTIIGINLVPFFVYMIIGIATRFAVFPMITRHLTNRPKDDTPPGACKLTNKIPRVLRLLYAEYQPLWGFLGLPDYDLWTIRESLGFAAHDAYAPGHYTGALADGVLWFLVRMSLYGSFTLAVLLLKIFIAVLVSNDDYDDGLGYYVDDTASHANYNGVMPGPSPAYLDEPPLDFSNHPDHPDPNLLLPIEHMPFYAVLITRTPLPDGTTQLDVRKRRPFATHDCPYLALQDRHEEAGVGFAMAGVMPYGAALEGLIDHYLGQSSREIVVETTEFMRHVDLSSPPEKMVMFYVADKVPDFELFVPSALLGEEEGDPDREELMKVYGLEKNEALEAHVAAQAQVHRWSDVQTWAEAQAEM
ncbi:hypothetical protein QBC39DRAFT_100319 [Podospora conica]|nr:hypothetical protein QBC39DRAFT_100319 [Schizothecium conicum]